jgi:hypothetical protein
MQHELSNEVAENDSNQKKNSASLRARERRKLASGTIEPWRMSAWKRFLNLENNGHEEQKKREGKQQVRYDLSIVVNTKGEKKTLKKDEGKAASTVKWDGASAKKQNQNIALFSYQAVEEVSLLNKPKTTSMMERLNYSTNINSHMAGELMVRQMVSDMNCRSSTSTIPVPDHTVHFHLFIENISECAADTLLGTNILFFLGMSNCYYKMTIMEGC